MRPMTPIPRGADRLVVAAPRTNAGHDTSMFATGEVTPPAAKARLAVFKRVDVKPRASDFPSLATSSPASRIPLYASILPATIFASSQSSDTAPDENAFATGSPAVVGANVFA